MVNEYEPDLHAVIMGANPRGTSMTIVPPRICQEELNIAQALKKIIK